MKKPLLVSALLTSVAVLAFSGAIPLTAQKLSSALQRGEWIDYGGDQNGLKYSPLSQITPANVDKLQVAWKWKVADADLQRSDPNLRGSRYEDTPLMVGGLVYTVTPLGMVAALDPATGQQTWLFDPRSYKEPKPHSNGWATRGLAYYADGKIERILHSTTDGYLYSIDAKTGQADSAFGNGGRVDEMEGVPNAIRSVNFIARRPVVAGNVLVLGNFLQDPQAGKEDKSPPGWVRAYDAHNGTLLWTFHIVPQKGEFGYDTWLNDSAAKQSNANSWGGMTYEPETDRVYFVTSSAGNDYIGITRPGDNLFADSIVAVEAKTGKRVWHFQAIHHDLWDYDFVTQPALIEVMHDGKKVKAIVGINKAAIVYLLDRNTGKPLFPAPETPIQFGEQKNGETPSKTQPMPPKTFQLDHSGSSYEQLADMTPEIKARALENAKYFDLAPVYTPGTDRGVLQSPGSLGGANWGGEAFDPDTGMLYVPTRTTFLINRMRGIAPASAPAADQHGAPPPPPPGSLTNIDGLPILKPPYARVTALDLHKGTQAWITPIGNGPRNHPLLAGKNVPPMGDAILGASPLVTKTMLFVSVTYTFVNGLPQPTAWEKWADPDFKKNVLYAMDKKTGKILKVFQADNLGAAGPMTYLYKGKQYIAIATGNGPDCELVAYTLPSLAPLQ